MSIEKDLEAFKELALVEQIKVPYYLEKFGSTQVILDNLDPILSEIVGDNDVMLNGEVYAPELSEAKQYLGHVAIDGNELPFEGSCNGVFVVNKKILDEDSVERYVVGYSVAFFKPFCRQSIFETTHSQFLAFGPVESCRLFVPKIRINKELFIPDADDEIAFSIDQALLQGKIYMGKLLEIFESLESHPELEKEYYVNYLNLIFPLTDYTLDVQTKSLILENKDAYYEMLNRDFISQFDCNPSHFEYTDNTGGLCIVFYDESKSDTEKYLIPMAEIHKLTFHSSR